MINTILILLSLLTPRSYTLFETPSVSLLSKTTLYFYPSTAYGFVPEFYINPFSGEGYFLITTGGEKISQGAMVSASSAGMMTILGLRKGASSVGMGLHYTKETESIDAAVFSFSHRTDIFGYDVGALYEDRAFHDYKSLYLRAFKSITDQTDVIAGLRGIFDENRGLCGFLSFISSPVSGQYVEGTIGYAPWLKQIYLSVGASHQFYRNFALSMGFYYPLKTLNAQSLTRSLLESPGVLPPYSDFRLGFDIQDNASIYTLSLALDYQAVRELISTGTFHPSTYEFKLSVSVYFYSF